MIADAAGGHAKRTLRGNSAPSLTAGFIVSGRGGTLIHLTFGARQKKGRA